MASSKKRDAATLFELISQQRERGDKPKDLDEAVRTGAVAQTPVEAVEPVEPEPVADVEPPQPEEAPAEPEDVVVDVEDVEPEPGPEPEPTPEAAEPQPEPVAEEQPVEPEEAPTEQVDVVEDVESEPKPKPKAKAKAKAKSKAKAKPKPEAVVEVEPEPEPEPEPELVVEAEPEPEPEPVVEPEPEPVVEVAPAAQTTPAVETTLVVEATPLPKTESAEWAPSPAPLAAVSGLLGPLGPMLVKVLLVAVLMIVAFLAGRYTAPDDPAPSDPAPAVNPLTVTTVPPVEPTEIVDTTPDTGDPDPVPISSGYWYVAVQATLTDSPDDELHAERIRSFCQANGCPATIQKITQDGGQDYWVVRATKPFYSPGDEEAIALEAKIKQLGQAYLAKHGTYSFAARPPGASPQGYGLYWSVVEGN